MFYVDMICANFTGDWVLMLLHQYLDSICSNFFWKVLKTNSKNVYINMNLMQENFFISWSSYVNMNFIHFYQLIKFLDIWRDQVTMTNVRLCEVKNLPQYESLHTYCCSNYLRFNRRNFGKTFLMYIHCQNTDKKALIFYQIHQKLPFFL